MDFNLAKTVFESLYSGVNGYVISQSARKKLSYHDKSHTYGEVTPEGFSKMLSDIPGPKRGNFYDLGSGVGKAVILASLFGDFSKLVGLELLEGLHKTANDVKAKYEQNVRVILPETKRNLSIDFIQTNFLEYDFSDADLIFTHSTCFYEELMTALERKFFSLKPGTKITTVTKNLISPAFRLIKADEYPMTWGKATVHIYEKT